MKEQLSFGVWLRKQRRALDLTRQAFADQVGCAEVTLRRIEAGTLKPSKELAGILLEKFGIPEAERLQWISFARGLSGFPSQFLPSSNKPITNLPAPLTTFIGREKEQSEVLQLLAKHRLVTLTGSGGVGKTRLSIKVGEQILGNYADGLWLVELAAILDPLLVPRTIALAIGLRDEPQRPVIDMLSDYLRDQEMLLILDNCEHLLDACAHLIDAVLKSCSHLKILATSREPLGITGEAIYRVPSLGLPDLQQLIENFREFESAKLFEERAQLAQFDFSLTLENASSVAHICHRLDGIPLAIELAAAKVDIFSTEQIAKQLDESFNLLTGGSRTTLPRHQTLRASMNWSWGLLTELEQIFMRQLSVFAGGWSLEAAQAVCDGDVLELTDSLVKKSLIVMKQEAGHETRYHFHETIRQYAREKLLETGSNEIIWDQHLAYYVKLAEKAELELFRSNQAIWLDKLDAELDNFRVAIEWASDTNIEAGLKMIALPSGFWQARGYMREARNWLELLIPHYDESNRLQVMALVSQSNCEFALNNLDRALLLAEKGLDVARKIGDKQVEAFGLMNLGQIMGWRGKFLEAKSLFEESLVLYGSLNDKLGQADVKSLMGLQFTFDVLDSQAYLRESLILYREIGHLGGIADCLSGLAHIAIVSGDLSSPTEMLEEAQIIFRQLSNPGGEATALQRWAMLAYWQGNYEQAYSLYEQTFELSERVGYKFISTWALIGMAYTVMRKGDLVKARRIFEESITKMRHAASLIGLVFGLEGLASLMVVEQKFESATGLFSFADKVRLELNDHRPPMEQADVDRDITVIVSKIGKATFSEAYDEGQKMTLDEAVAYALNEN